MSGTVLDSYPSKAGSNPALAINFKLSMFMCKYIIKHLTRAVGIIWAANMFDARKQLTAWAANHGYRIVDLELDED